MSVLEAYLPSTYDPTQLQQLALDLAALAPIWCATGGYVVSWYPAEKVTALRNAHVWCRRYLGLDVQEPEDMSWLVHQGLPSINWLTLMGTEFIQALGLDVASLRAPRLRSEMAVMDVPGAVIVRAGSRPALGDVNRSAYPTALREAAATLERHLVPEPGGFLGKAWQRRFTDPQGWN